MWIRTLALLNCECTLRYNSVSSNVNVGGRKRQVRRIVCVRFSSTRRRFQRKRSKAHTSTPAQQLRNMKPTVSNALKIHNKVRIHLSVSENEVDSNLILLYRMMFRLADMRHLDILVFIWQLNECRLNSALHHWPRFSGSALPDPLPVPLS